MYRAQKKLFVFHVRKQFNFNLGGEENMLLSIRCINSVFQQNTHVFIIQFASFEYLQFNDLVTKLRHEDEAKWKAAFVI